MKIFKKINISIKQKLFINPILNILSLGILFAIVFLGLSIQKKDIIEIYENKFKNFSNSTEISENILDIHSNLNQLLIWASSEKEKFRIKDESVNIIKQTDLLLNNFKEKLNVLCSANEKELCERIKNQLTDYKEWIILITENVGKNENNSNTYMLMTNEKLKELQKSLKQLKEKKLESGKISFEKSIKSNSFIKSSTSLSFIILILLSIIISIMLINSILIPLNNLKKILQDIAEGEGDLTKKIDIKRNDEIGELSNIFNTFIEKIKNTVIHIKKASNEGKTISKILSEISINVSDKIKDISGSIESDKNNINQLNNNLMNSVCAVSEISEAIKNITNLVDSQFESVHKSSVSTEEMSSIINNISKVINEKKNLSINLSSLAKQGLKNITESSDAINKIFKSSNNILEMMEIIDEIAKETNLLAMNAAIEAAHAGEYGKGFSIVSDEIRKLSEETSDNSKSINSALNQIILDINNFSQLNKITHESLHNIINGIQEVINAMEEMYTGINELVIGSNEIVKEITELTNISQNIKVNVSGINNSSDSINTNVKNITELSSVILNEINNIHSMATNISSSMNELTKTDESNKKYVLGIDNNLNQFRT